MDNIDKLLNLKTNEGQQMTEFDTEDSVKKVTDLVKQMSNSEKVDQALFMVTGLEKHDIEMNSVASEAYRSYQELMSLGMNTPVAHAAKIFDAANNMLRLVLEANMSKVDKKLKIIDMQLKKSKLDNQNDSQNAGIGLDRNDIIKAIKLQIIEEEPKTDK